MASQYTIKQGDTLSGIAKANNTTVANLQVSNPNITDINKIQAGSTLNIPTTPVSNYPINTTISASDIQNQKSVVIPTPINDTNASTNLGIANNVQSSQAISDIKTANTNNTQPTVTTDKKSVSDKILSLIGMSGTKEKFTSDLQTEQDITGKTQELNNINNKIALTTQSYDNQIKELKKNDVGAVGGGLQASINDLTRKKNEDLANLAIIKSVALNDLNTANSIIEKKVAAKFEPIDNQIKSYEQLYTLLQNDLTEKEKLQVQNNLETQKTNRDNVFSALKDVYANLALNKAPEDVYNAIDKVSTDFNKGTIDAITAINLINKSAGKYGAKNKSTLGVPFNGTLSPSAQSVVDNPNLINSFTPTIKGQIITELSQAGYDISSLGSKPLSDTAIKEINQSNTALSSLNDLKNIISNNKDLVGPITGLAAINPYSEARKIQADIDRVKQQVGKSLEGGVLRKEDEVKYKKILATITDTPDTAIYKIDELIKNIKKSIEDYTSLELGSGRSSNVTKSLNKKDSSTQKTDKTVVETPSISDLRTKYGY